MTLLNATIDKEVFLQGQYLSLGVNASGSLGTRATAPQGFYTDKASGYVRLGLYADTDGFGTGTASTLRDVMLPGTPMEGFSIGYQVGTNRYVHTNNERVGSVEIAGTGANSSTASVAKAEWSGATAEQLSVRQTLSLTDNAKYIRVDIMVTNQSASTMNDVRYMRTIDPDQGASSFATDNRIIEQGTDGALVAAYAASGGSPFFYYSQDPRAVVSAYGFQNDDPYNPLAFSSPQAEGYAKKEDSSVNITFGLGRLDAGKSATFTFYMGVTDNLDTTIASIDGIAVPNAAPVAIDDVFTMTADAVRIGNVLANDTDADRNPLMASLVSGPAHGTLKLSSDGSFAYTPTAGFYGTDSFLYAASDGKASDSGKVSFTVLAPPPPPSSDPTLPASPILQRAGTQNGSAATNDTLSGPTHHNSFYFDVSATTGADRITNFARDDVFVTNKALYDGNGDGFVIFSKGKLSIDAPLSKDTVTFTGVSGLRFLGEDEHGVFVYANAAVRPKGAIEGTVRDDVLKGDKGDLSVQRFFFDTALDIDLGWDRINDFGRKDVLVTTSALTDGGTDNIISVGTGAALKLVGGTGGPGDAVVPGEAGLLQIYDTAGLGVTALEFDGSVFRDGTTYYVYSAVGSAAGVSALGLA